MDDPDPRDKPTPPTGRGPESTAGTGTGCRTQAEMPGRGRHRKAMLEPAILLSLLDDDTHGYELIEQVEGLVGDDVCVDPGSTYRMLRAMEGDGLVVSSWVITDQGPNRRTYAITAAGREALAKSVVELRRRARALGTLAEEAESRLRRYPPDHPPDTDAHQRKGAAS